MLKEEDRSIKSKSKRVTDVIYIIEHDYIDTIKGEPILIDNWENIKKRLRLQTFETSRKFRILSK